MLSEQFYLEDTETVARNLIGKILVKNTGKKRLSAIITETEAYLSSEDSASHSAVGITKRNKAMFASGGILYVYKIYGIHHCINVVTESEGNGCAVLIRSGIPLEGINTMKNNRKAENEKQLLKGPGNFAKAFGFTFSDNFSSLRRNDLFLADGLDIKAGMISISKRIGISKSQDKMLRFFLSNTEFISGVSKWNLLSDAL